MYSSSDHHQIGVTDHKINKSHCPKKRIADQNLDLSLSMANDIKILIMSLRVVSPSSHMVLSQIGSMS